MQLINTIKTKLGRAAQAFRHAWYFLEDAVKHLSGWEDTGFKDTSGCPILVGDKLRVTCRISGIVHGHGEVRRVFDDFYVEHQGDMSGVFVRLDEPNFDFTLRKNT